MSFLCTYYIYYIMQVRWWKKKANDIAPDLKSVCLYVYFICTHKYVKYVERLSQNIK